jgi:UDP-N-acetylmuramate dehydrogenase
MAYRKNGWKGKRFGHVGVHAKQALVLVNYGGASGEELIHLSKEIQAGVMEEFRIHLEPEVTIIK